MEQMIIGRSVPLREIVSPDKRVIILLPDAEPNYHPEVDELIRSMESSQYAPQDKQGGAEGALSCFNPAQVGLQFKCGKCIKKAFAYGDNASLIYKFKLNWCRQLELDFVKIDKAKRIIVVTYCGGKAVDHQVVKELVVSGKFHCNGETDIIELDPEWPDNIGLSEKVFEIDCGAVCKKVANVDFVFDGGEIVSLFPPPGQSLTVKAFADGKLFNKQCVGQVIVEKKKIVSQEKLAVEI